jgi:hypothetical protein
MDMDKSIKPNKMDDRGPWIGVDLDGTLAEYTSWKGPEHIGKPILPMVERVKRWLANGHRVKIFTARAYNPDNGVPVAVKPNAEAVPESLSIRNSVYIIREWLVNTAGLPPLEVTCIKDALCVEIWDDRCVAVEANTGRSLNPSRRGL